MEIGSPILLSPVGVFLIILVAAYLAILLVARSYARRWNLTGGDIAILLIATTFGCIFFNPNAITSLLYPSPLGEFAPFISLALGLMLGILILLILQRVSPHGHSLST